MKAVHVWCWPVSFLLCTCLYAFDQSEWKLSFQDDFDRAALGPDWVLAGRGEIVDGRLKFGLDNSHLALVNRHFSPDVRIEFDAQPAPEKPPCDLSVGLGAGVTAGKPENGYLLAFGGNFNSMNQIQGGREMKWVNAWYGPQKIQPGKVHHVCGMKEGKTLTLEVDGQVLLTTTDEDPLGGPGYDMAGLVTWNGMLVDHVRVYERKVKHPDTPRYVTRLRGLPFKLDDHRRLSAVHPGDDANIQKGLDAFNGGLPRAAEQAFLASTDAEMRAAGAAYALGHLYYEPSIEDLARVGQMLIDLAIARPEDDRLQDYAEVGRGVQALRAERFAGQPNGELAANAVIAMGQADNPMFDRALFLKARLMRAHSMEGGGQGMDVPMGMFAELKKWYPRHASLLELTGESIPWGEELIDDTSSAPAWARYLRELYARQCAVLNWWFTHRQYKDGQLGGGWGDDCEILRDWGPLAAISNGDPAIVAGIERLCDGIWTGAINPEYGFSGFGDAEHSSEPSTDTQPTMMILRWGDPLWIERNMRSAKTIRDIYMGVDQTGHYRFRSGFYGDGRVGTLPKQEGDVQYNTRTMKHLQQLAWYGNLEARRVYLSWIEGWLQQTMTDYANKPAGVVPGQLFFPSGTITPPEGTQANEWFSTNAPNPDDALGFSGMIQGGFLAGYRFTHDPKYLEPIYRYLMWTSTGPLLRGDASSYKPGSRERMLRAQQGDTQNDTVALFWWLTGDRTADEYLLRFASPYQRYMVTNDLNGLMKSVETAAKSLRTNFRLMTEEQLQTDRAGLPASGETLGAFTGAIHTWRDGLTPTMAVTWDVPDTNFAALVVASSDKRMRVWVYSFHDQPVTMGMRLWRLTPGVYETRCGAILPGESTNLRYEWTPGEPFTYRRRADSYRISVPPHVAYAIDLRLTEPIEVPSTAPDLAIADRDVKLETAGTIQAVVHNVGNAEAHNVKVQLEWRDTPAGRWQVAETQTIDRMALPELEPVTQTIEFTKVASGSAYRVVLDPDQKLDELFEGNNVGTLHAGR